MSKNKEPLIVDGINVSKCCYVIDYDPPEWQGTWGGAIHKGACRVYSKDCKYNPNCYFKQLARKTQECENLKAEEKYLKQCCAKAGEELAKHSFEYDGKEKNLVVQVMELNEKYELLKIQNQQQYIEFKNKEINYEEQIRQLRLLNKELRDCLENDLTKLCVQKQEVLNEIK